MPTHRAYQHISEFCSAGGTAAVKPRPWAPSRTAKADKVYVTRNSGPLANGFSRPVHPELSRPPRRALQTPGDRARATIPPSWNPDASLPLTRRTCRVRLSAWYCRRGPCFPRIRIASRRAATARCRRGESRMVAPETGTPTGKTSKDAENGRALLARH